jgi:hypothetical protein
MLEVKNGVSHLETCAIDEIGFEHGDTIDRNTIATSEVFDAQTALIPDTLTMQLAHPMVIGKGHFAPVSATNAHDFFDERYDAAFMWAFEHQKRGIFDM